MSEWSKETDSKSVVSSDGTEGSNPSLSESSEIFFELFIDLRRGVRVVEGARLEGVCAHKAPGVRIPPPPLFPQSDRFCAIGSRPTPSGPEGSSGKWFDDEPQAIYLLGFFLLQRSAIPTEIYLERFQK